MCVPNELVMSERYKDLTNCRTVLIRLSSCLFCTYLVMWSIRLVSFSLFGVMKDSFGQCNVTWNFFLQYSKVAHKVRSKAVDFCGDLHWTRTHAGPTFM